MITSSTLRSPHLRVIERTLMVLAVVLLGWCAVQLVSTWYAQVSANRELEEIRMSPAASPVTQAHNQTRLIKGSLVGRVEMPRLGLSAMVREGDDAGTLQRAVGHIPETALPGEPGNAGLAGHRDTFFRRLRDARPGDRIVVTTPDAVIHYAVRDTRIVEPTEVAVLAPTSEPTLTLVTCYPFNYVGAAPKRFIVRADRTDGRQ